MIYFTALRPRMIAAANPIAATSPYLMKMKSTSPNKTRNVKMAVAVLPPEVVFDFIKTYLLSLTFGHSIALLYMKLYKIVDSISCFHYRSKKCAFWAQRGSKFLVL